MSTNRWSRRTGGPHQAHNPGCPRPSLGLVSLFTDVSSEAIFPLLPVFLTTLGASNAIIGLIEGVAELVANVLKYLTGIIADRRTRLKPLILVGYGVSTVIRPLVASAASPWHVLAVWVGDRVGKGVSTSPRDALIAHATDPTMRSRAYGFHRAMDHRASRSSDKSRTPTFLRLLPWSSTPG